MRNSLVLGLIATSFILLAGAAWGLFALARTADSRTYYLMVSAFLGAFFSFLFVRAAEGLSTIYKRRAKAYSALVLLQHHLNTVLTLLDDNSHLASSFVETVSRAAEDKSRIFASTNRLSSLPMDTDAVLHLTNIDLINDMVSYNVTLRKLNNSMDVVMRLYDRSIEGVMGQPITEPIRETYRSNVGRVVTGMNTLDSHLKEVRKETVVLLAKVRLLGRRPPFLIWIMHQSFQVKYPRSFSSSLENELQKLDSEFEASERRSGERLKRIKENE